MKRSSKMAFTGLLAFAALMIAFVIPAYAKEYGDETVNISELEVGDVLTSGKTTVVADGDLDCDAIEYAYSEGTAAGGGAYTGELLSPGQTHTIKYNPASDLVANKWQVALIKSSLGTPVGDVKYNVFLFPKCEHTDFYPGPKVNATCTTAGHEAFWQCSKCGKYFSDEFATNPISDIAVWLGENGDGYIPATGHELIIKNSADMTVLTVECAHTGCPLSAMLSVDGASGVYTGKPYEGALFADLDFASIVGVDSLELFYATEEELIDGKPIDAGSYYAAVVFEYDGEEYGAFAPIEIEPADLVVEGIKDEYEYTGEGVIGQGDYHVFGVDDEELEEGTDFIVSIDEGRANNQTPGRHTIKFISQNPNYNNAEITYEIVKDDNPKTADTYNMALYVALAALAAAGGIILIRKKETR